MQDFRYCEQCGNTLPLGWDKDTCAKCLESTLKERVRDLEEQVEEIRALLAW